MYSTEKKEVRRGVVYTSIYVTLKDAGVNADKFADMDTIMPFFTLFTF